MNRQEAVRELRSLLRGDPENLARALSNLERTRHARTTWQTVTYVPLDSCDVDNEYQRPALMAHIRRIARDYFHLQERIAPASLRKGVVWILDGQQSGQAKMMNGERYIRVQLHLGLTRREEAKIFYGIATGSRRLVPVDAFRAALVARIPEWVARKAVIDKHGFFVEGLNEGARTMTITDAGAIKLVSRKDTESLDKALAVLKKWRDTGGVDGHVLRGTAKFFALNPDARPGVLASALRGTPREVIRLRVVAAMAKAGKSSAKGNGATDPYYARELEAVYDAH